MAKTYTEFEIAEVLEASKQIRLRSQGGTDIEAGYIVWRKEEENHVFTGRKVVAYQASDDNDTGSLVTLDNTKGLVVGNTIVFKSKKDTDDFLNTGEIALEDTYLYDDTLPLSVNGTIAFKTGSTNESPLLKLQFNEPKNTWNVIGVRLVGYNQNNEPYNIYALASEGRLKQILESQTLEDVILANIDKLFEENKAELELKLQEILDPLIKAETAKIPELVQKEIEANIDEIIEREINEKIDEAIKDVVLKNVDEALPNYNYTDKGAYKRGSGAWTGIIKRWGVSNSNLNPRIGTKTLFRRINCGGLEEEWQSVAAYATKENSKVKAFFDDLEPYKTMEKLEILYEDLNKLVGNEVYTKSTYELFKNKHQQQWGKYWNGSFIDVDSIDTINNRQSSWFVPFKKCHYIHTFFYLNGNKKVPYELQCVGEEPFSVNLKDYFPDAVSIEYECGEYPTLGINTFNPTDEAENRFLVDSHLHPAFYDGWNTSGEPLLPEEFKELDYIYMGCFNGSLGNVDRSVWTNSLSSKTKLLESKPKQYNFHNRDTDNGYYNIIGDNPSIGVNMRPPTEYYTMLVELMMEIEIIYCNISEWATINTEGVTYSGELLYKEVNKMWAYSGESFYNNNKLFWRGYCRIGCQRVAGSWTNSSKDLFIAIPFTQRKLVNLTQNLGEPKMVKVGRMQIHEGGKDLKYKYMPPFFINSVASDFRGDIINNYHYAADVSNFNPLNGATFHGAGAAWYWVSRPCI